MDSLLHDQMSLSLCEDSISEAYNELTRKVCPGQGKIMRHILHFIHDAAMQKPDVVLMVINRLSCSQYNGEKILFSLPTFILLSETLSGIRLPVFHDYEENFSQAVKLWCNMASCGLKSGHRRNQFLCHKFASSLWRQNPPMLTHVLDYIMHDVLTVNSLVLIGDIVRYVQDNSLLPLSEDHQILALDSLLKNALGTKSGLLPDTLAICSEIMTTCGDVEYFKKSIMPNLLRGILRSAEANLTVVNALVVKLPFNLDLCAMELSEPIIKHLFATSGQIRDASVQVLTTIASRCSEGDTLSALCKMVHAHLVGPEGKKAGHEARLAGLSSLGSMSAHGLKRSAAVERVASTAVNLLIDYVEQEAHEPTLIYAAKQMSKWLCGMHSNLPDRFYSFIKASSLNVKMSSTVRCAYLACLDSGLARINIGERLPAPLVASLLTAAQRGVGQPNHSPLLCESVCASLVWLRHFVATRQQQLGTDGGGGGTVVVADLHASPQWNLLVSSSAAAPRKALFSDGFLRKAPEYVLEKLASLLGLILGKLHHLIPMDTQRAACRNLLLLALHPHYSTVRQPALASLKALVRSDLSTQGQTVGGMLTRQLLCELFHCLQETSGSLSDPANRLPFEESPAPGSEQAKKQQAQYVLGQPRGVDTSCPDLRVWSEAVQTTGNQTGDAAGRSPDTGTYVSQLISVLLTVPPRRLDEEEAPRVVAKDKANESEDSGDFELSGLYVASLFPASHPMVVSSAPRLWEKLRHRLGLPDCGDVNDSGNQNGVHHQEQHWEKLVEYFIGLPTLDQTHCCAVQRLIRWAPMSFGKRLFDALHTRLSSDRLLSVTRQEIEIMLTPDTEIYNQELLESFPKYHTSINIKRASKLYSYDDQMDILATRKKLEESRRQKLLPPLLEQLAKQLTDKQLETVRQELDREAGVRSRVAQLDREARFLSSLLTNALAGCLHPDSLLLLPASHCQGRRRRSRVHLDSSRFFRLILSISTPYSTLFQRLLASHLVAPYTLRSYVSCLVLLMTTTPLVPPAEQQMDVVKHAHLLAWWSMRLLQPSRLFRHRSDAEISHDADGRHGDHHWQDIQVDVVQTAVMDAEELVGCWSAQSLGEQTRTVLDWCLATYPTQNLNALLAFGFLCPTFERILVFSGWALPLEEEAWLDGTLPTTEDQRKRWEWVAAEHCQKLLTVWLNQLQQTKTTDGGGDCLRLRHQVTLHTLPFDRLLRLMRQVVDSCLSCASVTRSLTEPPDDVDGDTNSNVSGSHCLMGEAEQLRMDLARPLAQLSLDVIRSASAVFSDLMASEPRSQVDKTRLDHLACVVLETLVTGFVAPSAEAREICGRVLLSLVENVPGFLDHVMSADEQLSSSGATQAQQQHSDDECGDGWEDNEEGEVDRSARSLPGPSAEATDATAAQEKSEAGKPQRKKLNKAQRLKQKQASLLAKVKMASANQQMTKPFINPAQWPKLTLWQTLHLRVWIARCDASPEVAMLADRLWTSLKLPDVNSFDSMTAVQETSEGRRLLSPVLLVQRLLLETTRPISAAQKATADAFALSLLHRHSPDEVAVALDQLIQLYRTMLHREPVVRDNIGRIVVPESPDLWRERLGLAMALTRLPEALNPREDVIRTLRPGYTAGLEAKMAGDDEVDGEANEEVTPGADAPSTETVLGAGQAEVKAKRSDMWLLNMYRFLVPDGLNDPNPRVAGEMLQAGLRGIAIYGKANIQQLLPILEGFLTKAPNVAELDAVRQSTLLLTGSLSQHLATHDPRVVNVFNRLINTLNFPSDVVQQSVQDCIASLVTKLPEDHVSKTIGRLMTSLFGSASYAERSGAAHGIAGIARGLGIMSLKHHGIIDKLLPALTDSKAGKKREGALMAIERLCLGLGRLFEPYVVRLISGLLNAFGDANPNVREAASNTARAVMSKLSAHGVKIILPALLRAIDDQQSWRTKAESVELLATITHCAPKQLSACLPQIVPRLLEVLVDSQDSVKQAGVRALRQIGNVIRNPEVQALVPLLTNCLQDPLADKMPCLLALRDTCFIHVVGAPSLALILPVIHRALNERSTEARKIAAQIFGNLPSLSRKEELQPYVSTILPPLKTCLLDAVPEVRSVAAAAFGALVRGMGESCFSEILSWLTSTLTSEVSSADRSGAAQGLAEVLGAMGVDRLRTILLELIQTTTESESRGQAHVRDGYLMLFVYLPVVLQDDFREFIRPIIPTILKSLSDEAEFLRETALRAAQCIIQMFADSSVELLLPELEKGMSDLNWRIRHASVQLLGDLLFQLSGLSGKGTTKTQDEDETFGSTEVHQRLKQAMGIERHDRIVARLHIARSDPTLIVRQAAIHVWKVVVANSSRTLREIVPVLIQVLLGMLGSSSREQQQLAATALGDVVKRLGERVLPEVIPLLVAGLNSPHADQCRGVCNGLNAIIRNCQREQLANYSDILLAPLRRTLSDRQVEVRRSAARTFDLLYGILGVRALDGILPDLLAQLDASDASEEAQSFALDGVRQLLAVRSKAVMPYLVPKLTQPTVNVKAFSYLASVAGDALTRQLNRILPALLATVRQLNDGSVAQQDLDHCARVLVCIYDVAGVRYILNELVDGLSVTSSTTTTVGGGGGAQGNEHRIACLRLLHAYLELSSQDEDAETVAGAQTDQVSKTVVALEESSSGDDAEEDEEDDGTDDGSSGNSDDDDENNSDDDYVSDDDADLDEDLPDTKETVARVLKELHPLMFRNICRLLAVDDRNTLVHTWNCLESLLKRWSPETVGTQINDLRQGVRGAVSEMNKTSLGVGRATAAARPQHVVPGEERDCPSATTLPGFSDPSLPQFVSLVKMYADCTLRGRQEIREASAQALDECIIHASGPALQRCTVKVIGPLIRLMGERQINVVRLAVVNALTTLVTKCPQSARPFVTQLQATFLKCLADSHRPLRLLAGRALASLVVITPKLEPLLADLTRIPVEAIRARCPSTCLPGHGGGGGHGSGSSGLPTRGGTAATALTLASLAAYPDTCLHALRVCLLASPGKTSLSGLQFLSGQLAPLLCLPDDLDLDNQVDVSVVEEDHDVYEEEEGSREAKAGGGSSAFNTTVIRVTAAACLGACVVSAGHVDGAMDLLLHHVLQPTEASNEKAYLSWEWQQSQAVALLIAFKHTPAALVTRETIDSGALTRLEMLLDRLFSTPTQESQHPVICQTALRCVGCLLGYVFGAGNLQYNPTTGLQLLHKAIKHELTDVRLLSTVVANHIAWRASITTTAGSSSPAEWVPEFLALLMQASREKSSSVRLGSETALAVLCRLGAPAWNKTHSYSAICKVCTEGTTAGLPQGFDTLVQRLRKQDWSEVWRQGAPDMDNTLVI